MINDLGYRPDGDMRPMAEPPLAPAIGSAAAGELIEAIIEFRRHAMYPYPDCSDEKKMAFINADKRLSVAIKAFQQNS